MLYLELNFQVRKDSYLNTLIGFWIVWLENNLQFNVEINYVGLTFADCLTYQLLYKK